MSVHGRYIPTYKLEEKGCWITRSNRWKHMIGGFVLGLTLTVLCALGCAGGMEFKDVAYNNGDWRCFDWLDFLATIIGGVIGQAIQIGIILLICR